MPDVSASGRLNVFFLCSLSQYIYIFLLVHKFFRVSGLGISARARGNFMHNNILRHTYEQFAEGGQVRGFCHVEARVIDVPRGKKHYISAD